jgi:hypothetical protein
MVTGLIRSSPGLDKYQIPGNRSRSGLLKKGPKDRTGPDLKALLRILAIATKEIKWGLTSELILFNIL